MRFIKLWVVLFTILPTTFIVLGAYLIWSQKQRINTYLSVPAEVLSVHIDKRVRRSENGSTSSTYAPVVEYEYRVENQRYESKNVLPSGDVAASQDWAKSITVRFPVGKKVTAYYDPNNPTKSFLLRELQYFPYLIAQFPMLIMLVIALGMVHADLGRPKIKPPRPQSGGSFELIPRITVARRIRQVMLITIIWYAVGMATSGHFFWYADGQYGKLALVCTAVYLGMGLFPLGQWFYYSLLGRSFGQVSVLTDTAHYRLGEPVTVFIEQPVKTGLTVSHMELAVVCRQTDKNRGSSESEITSKDAYADRATVVEQQKIESGDPLSGTHSFTLPTDAQPSSPAKHRGHPCYDWFIEATTKVRRRPDYRGQFPIFVEGSQVPDAPAAP